MRAIRSVESEMSRFRASIENLLLSTYFNTVIINLTMRIH